MSIRRIFVHAASLLIASLLLAVGVSAQGASAPARSPLELAQRLLGYAREDAFSAPTPIYALGDVERFWVPRRGADAPQQIDARLVAVAPGVDLWVEEGVEPEGVGGVAEARTPEALDAALAALAQQYSQIFDVMRLRANFGETGSAPPQGEAPLPEDFLPIPNVDSDPRIAILYTRDLPFEQIAWYNPIDSIPAALVAGGRSNERETILVSTSVFATAPIDAPLYVSAVVEAYIRMVANYNYPGQPAWLQELMSDLTLQQLEDADIPLRDMVAYLLTPDTPLLATRNFITSQTVNGAQQLFMSYFFQRYGSSPLLSLFRAQGSGISPVDAVLRENGIVDALTSEPVTARSAFADFVMANVLNGAFGDGRYVHTTVTFPQNIRARVTRLEELGDTIIANRVIAQFGAYYLLLSNTLQTPQTVSIGFDGAPAAARLPMGAARSLDDSYYWSGAAMDANPRMTRAIDLRAALAATLTFDAWYTLPRGINYAYVSVSDDGGATWAVLPATSTTAVNPIGAAYAPGFTGVSSAEAPRPFPLLGVALGADGVTVTAVTPDGPAETAGLRAGDRILGYDGLEWDRVPNIIAVLAGYAPGDTITLIVSRGEGDAAAQFDLPVELGTFPTRTLEPDPVWMPQSVDLSAYAGKEILLRFEVVTLPGYDTAGLAVDNLEIAEVNFADGGDAVDDWAFEGFSAVTNAVQQPYIVQAFVAPAGSDLPSINMLIPPGDVAVQGTWSFRLAPGQPMIVAVSPVSDETLVPASFTLSVDVENADA